MNYNQWIFRLFLSTGILALFLMITNYIIDPFQHYRIPSWYSIFNDKQREIVPGLAKNARFETAIVGSSMAENFQPTLINQELQTTSFKLCMAGMTAFEMHHLLKIVIHHQPDIKNIIIATDFYSFSGEPTKIRFNKLPFYLYDDNNINDISYLLNIDTFTFSTKILRRHINKPIDYDNLWYWGDQYIFSKKTVLSSYQKDKFNASFKKEDYQYEILKKSFETNILRIIEDNPTIHFILFYPPYSYLTYKDIKKKQWLKNTFAFKRYLVNLSLSNLTIYDFQCIPSITENLDNYKDISHYSPNINKYIIHAMKEKKFISNLSNVEECIKTIQESADKPYIKDLDIALQ